MREEAARPQQAGAAAAGPVTAAGRAAGHVGGGTEDGVGYVSAAKRDALKKREWEKKHASGDGGQVRWWVVGVARCARA